MCEHCGEQNIFSLIFRSCILSCGLSSQALVCILHIFSGQVRSDVGGGGGLHHVPRVRDDALADAGEEASAGAGVGEDLRLGHEPGDVNIRGTETSDDQILRYAL